MKRFLTLFLRTENIHLTKDVGMIPYFLHTESGYDSTIACYNNGDYDYLKTEVSGLNIIFVKKIFNNEFLDTLIFLLRNSKKYDILQMYHLSRLRSFLLFIYKLLSVKGAKTYIKLDADDSILDFHYKGFIDKLYISFVRKIDIISVETKELYRKLNEQNTFGRQVAYIPNGYYQRYDVGTTNKENIFLTVGRIGSYQKNTEILLQAFEKFALINTSWTLQVVGPVEDSFREYIDEFFLRNPVLKERVNFSGLINDKQQLAIIYQKARVFILTSRYESFGLVYLEALQAGCYILSTDLIPAQDITDNGKYGTLFPVGDADALLTSMLNAVKNVDEIDRKAEETRTFARENFSWPVIIRKLDKLLKDGTK